MLCIIWQNHISYSFIGTKNMNTNFFNTTLSIGSNSGECDTLQQWKHKFCYRMRALSNMASSTVVTLHVHDYTTFVLLISLLQIRLLIFLIISVDYQPCLHFRSSVLVSSQYKIHRTRALSNMSCFTAMTSHVYDYTTFVLLISLLQVHLLIFLIISVD